MIYVNIDSEFNIDAFGIDKAQVFDIIPSPVNFNINNFLKFSRFYTGDDIKMNIELTSILKCNLRDWIIDNTEAFEVTALQFTLRTHITNFVLQYVSIYSIALNLFINNSKVTILCPVNLKLIRYEICSPLISLIALLNAAAQVKSEVLFLENQEGVWNSILNHRLDFQIEKIQTQLNTSISLECIAAEISKSETIKYTLMNRNVNEINEKFREPFEVLPGDFSLNSGRLGVWNFMRPKLRELKTKWKNCISTHPLAIKLESNFFESYFIKVILPLEDFEKELQNAYAFSGKSRNLVVEEATDIYALPLLSASKRSGLKVHMFQHSSNALLEWLFIDRGGVRQLFPERIYAQSKKTYSQYQGLSPNLDVVFLPFIPAPTESVKRENLECYILIIENDFFRYFGIPINVNHVLAEIISTITLLIQSGHNKFIWRQRCPGLNPVYEILKKMVPEANIMMHDTVGHAFEVFKYCDIALGFGTNSSLAIDFIKSGGVYFQVGTIPSGNEYATMPTTVTNMRDPFSVSRDVDSIRCDKKAFLDLQYFQSNEITKY